MIKEHAKPAFQAGLSLAQLDGEVSHALYSGLKLCEAFFYLHFLFLGCTSGASLFT
jgi:hypothetical protein